MVVLALDEKIQRTINFDLDKTAQSQLEETVRKIILKVNAHLRSYGNTTTIIEKSKGDEQIDLDVIANDIIQGDYREMNMFTEESPNNFLDLNSHLIVADPIDGSSEINRIGPYSNPLSTSIMLIKGDQVMAAVSGDIFKGHIYGIDDKGLYRICIKNRNPAKTYKTYITINENSTSNQPIRLAAYSRNHSRALIAKAICELLKSGVVEYFGNDGGGMYPIQVALGRDRGYNCAAELLPKELYEHVTEIMATKAGAKLSRLDGSPLEVNPMIKQTSVIAVNDEIRKALIDGLKKTYRELKIAHIEPIYIPN